MKTLYKVSYKLFTVEPVKVKDFDTCWYYTLEGVKKRRNGRLPHVGDRYFSDPVWAAEDLKSYIANNMEELRKRYNEANRFFRNAKMGKV